LAFCEAESGNHLSFTGPLMGTLIGWLATTFVGEKFARPVAYAGLFLLILAALGGVKCAYDRNIIRNHDLKQEAATAKADRKADTKAAEQRRVDDARLTAETTEIKEAVNEARQIGADPRAAYYRCVSAQQSARRERKPPADC
jgi:hypothetical protein